MPSTDERLDELMEHCKKHEDPTGENGFFRTNVQDETPTGEDGRDDRESGFGKERVEVMQHGTSESNDAREASTLNNSGNDWQVTFRDVKHADPGVQQATPMLSHPRLPTTHKK